MTHNWLVLLPPFIVLLSAMITRHLNLSLAVGIVAAALISTDFSLVDASLKIIERIFATVTDLENLQMYSFLFMISILIVLLNRTGGAAAFAQKITQRLQSRRSAESSSLLLSLTLFIDDYLSCLTVGYVMRPIFDTMRIPRAKLAYLVHGMTGPLVILAPISSWVAAITATLDQAGVSSNIKSGTVFVADPYFMYIQSIPYIFYSFLTIASAWFIVRKGISFGSMHEHEKIAQETGNLFGAKQPITDQMNAETVPQGTLSDLLIPLITLIASVFLGTLWTGNYYLFGGTNSLLDAFRTNTQIFLVLFSAGLISLIVSFILAFARKRISITQVPGIVWQGIDLMWSAVLMVALASTLSKMLRLDLHTGEYLAVLLQGVISLTLLPCIFFITSSITSILIGSSWGTMMIFIPIALPMITQLAQIATPADPASIAILFPVLGAIFSGAVSGDHLSPISATTIMAATSSGAYTFDHFKTQLPYGIPALFFSALAFLLTGIFVHQHMLLKIILPTAVGIFGCCLTLWLLNYTKKR